jgi:23S rRNA pseudouridine2604 synthase
LAGLFEHPAQLGMSRVSILFNSHSMSSKKLIKRSLHVPLTAGQLPPKNQPVPASDKDRRIRINKFFTAQGTCSRREADTLIEDGRVTINGRVAVLGDRVGPHDVITKDGLLVPWGNAPLYIKFHKPVGVTTTSEPHVKDNIIASISHPERIFPIGRLDKDSSGLILLTNDGDIVNRVLRAEYAHEKEYVVQVDRPFDQVFLDRMAAGVVILGERTRPCRVNRVGSQDFRIILTEGRNRQIRRMCQALGYRVLTLHRTRIMHITIEGLRAGQWQYLTEREQAMLLDAVHISK